MTTAASSAISARQREMAQRGLARWKHDPVLFAREVLGVTPWHRQADILRSVDKHSRVAVRSGHKVSKSNSAACIALWWVSTRRDARVLMTSSSGRQVKDILWRELRLVHRRALIPVGGTLNEMPSNGLKFSDGREVLGFSTDESEKAAGYSGENVLYLIDEASGVDEKIFEAIEGNRAGGARMILFSNPTQPVGTFFDAFHEKSSFWHTIHVSSEEASEVTPRIPGLAKKEWVQEKREEWGVDSPLYQVRVLGNFPEQGSNCVIGLVTLTGAHERMDVPPTQEDEECRLECGLDAAREGDDDSELCLRRGKREVAKTTLPKGDGPTVAAAAHAFIGLHRREGETPRVKVDVIGVGASVFDSLARMEDLEVIPVNVAHSADTASDEEQYSNLRTQLWFGLNDWLQTGAILPDSKRDGELVAPRYGFDSRGRQQVEKKDAIKARLRRSPDRAEALMLAVYNPPTPFANAPEPPVLNLLGNWTESGRSF